MNKIKINTQNTILVAIDIAKAQHCAVIRLTDGKTKKLQISSSLEGHQKLIQFLKSFKNDCVIGFEATGNYHRTLAYALQKAGFNVYLISSIAAARTREALYNSWDKNDPKDAQVILHLLSIGNIQVYHDPLIHQNLDIQEIAQTYRQISLRKVKTQHSIMNHYLPLYFPEVEKYFCSSRALWFSSLLSLFPTPSSITKYSCEEFIQKAWKITGRKIDKKRWLEDFYQTAQKSIGLPIPENSQAIQMFRVILQEHQNLCQKMKDIELLSEQFLSKKEEYQRLRSIPGIGPIIALVILSEAGDLTRFSHYRQFLKFCGFDLSTQQSGYFRGQSKLSKRGNSTLRCVFWMAGTIALRMRENTFRRKYENYIKKDPLNKDLKRKAYTAVAAKMARTVYGVVKNKLDYQRYFDYPVKESFQAAVEGKPCR
jgi:transposase